MWINSVKGLNQSRYRKTFLGAPSGLAKSPPWKAPAPVSDCAVEVAGIQPFTLAKIGFIEFSEKNHIMIKSWVDKMQEDLVTLARTASGVDQLAAIYLKNRHLYTVEANNPRQLVEIAARDIEKLLSNRSKALVASIKFIPYKKAMHCGIERRNVMFP
ncbi:voltage-dependent calcium channel subunit alpha-2 delta- hypothetical protein [Limosa lapponica baueri]|uniref:Uncharacterized protein n=1 Tax=Limosa lapponica baueri TaxID=1758121 RepID=A0A2I0U8W8_LIMLA|nr:voltage-dependent calcium channel subunit alpha-2 delta- hypothetical protein [Limosa lapponica baueri]